MFAVVAVIGFAGIYWLVSARKWFTGPRVQGSAAELQAIEEEAREHLTAPGRVGRGPWRQHVAPA